MTSRSSVGRTAASATSGSLAASTLQPAYIGITEAQLRTELESGKSLAQVAKAHGKSVDGLIDALVAAAKDKLDNAVSAGRLTKAQETEMLGVLKDRVTSAVNGTDGLGEPHFRRPGVGFRHFDGPTA